MGGRRSKPALSWAFTMTLAHGTDRLEAARLVLRRIVPDDLPFFTHLLDGSLSLGLGINNRFSQQAVTCGRSL